MLTTEKSPQWDVQNFELCVQKILEHSGFTISRVSSPTSKRITFLAEGQGDTSKLRGVSCISKGETLEKEDLDAIIAEGDSLSCPSNFVISLVSVSPDAAAWAKENKKISLVDQRAFLQTYQQLPDDVKNEIETLATETPDGLSEPEITTEGLPPLSEDPSTTESAIEISEPEITTEGPPPLPENPATTESAIEISEPEITTEGPPLLSENPATTKPANEISEPEITTEGPPPLSEIPSTMEPANEISEPEITTEGPPPLSEIPSTTGIAKEVSEPESAPPVSEISEDRESVLPEIEVSEETEVSSDHHEPAPTNKKALSKTNWKKWLMLLGGALICLFVLVNVGAAVRRALSKPGKPTGNEMVVVPKKPESPPENKAISTPGDVAPLVSQKTDTDESSPVAPDAISTNPDGEDPPNEGKPTNQTGENVSDIALSAPDRAGPAISDPVDPIAPASVLPDAAESGLAHRPSDPVRPTPALSTFEPAQFSDDKTSAYVDLDIPPDAPIWDSAERDDLALILKSIWDLDKLEDDPFFDLGQAILTRNLSARGGPLPKDESMALWALGGKLRDYPQLGCGALTILSPEKVPLFLESLEPAIRNLKDPFLSFQVASTRAGLLASSQSAGDALDSLKSIFQTVEPEQLPDSIAFFLIASEFASGVRSAAPDRFITLVEKSSAIPGWLKDYVGGKALYSRAGKDKLVRVAEMITKFESSWEANPGHPAAAAELIMLNSIVSGGELSEIRLWFDRSIKAQADYRTAYYNYAKALAKIGDPSERLEIEFGKSCCRTGRFDTSIPLTLLDAHTLRSAALGKVPRDYWSSLPESDIEDLDALFQKLAGTNHLPYEAAVEKSLESVIWYFAGDEEKLARCLKDENFIFDPGAFDTLKLRTKDREAFNEFMKEYHSP